MPFRPEANAAIGAESSRKPTDTVGWSSTIDGVGAAPHKQCTVTNEDGFLLVFTILNAEGLSMDEIDQQCQHDTINEIRRRRGTG